MNRKRALVIRAVLAAVLAAPLGAWPVEARQQQPGQPATGAKPSPRSVRGFVFEDANGNGARDAGERGVPGARVSDQYGVVSVAAEGGYQIVAAEAAGVVYVTAPEGWAVRGIFWRPLGSEAAQQHDFPLHRVNESSEFTFVHASDTHLSPASLPRMAKLRAAVEKTKPAFVIITGDLVRDALRVGEAEARGYYDLLAAELKKFNVPVWTVPGNHEIFGIERHLSLVSPQHPLYGKKMYRHYLGPNYYSFNFGGVHFVGVDSVDVADLWYHGHVDAAQMEWLARDLAAVPAGTPVVTFNHIPFMSAMEGLRGYTDEEPAPTLIRTSGATHFRHVVSNTTDVLATIRKNHRLEIALGGHFHTRETLNYESQGARLRFYQTAAVVGPNEYKGISMTSGITLYRVRNGKVDDGTFIPLD